MKSWIKIGCVLFALPLFAFVFFTYARGAESNLPFQYPAFGRFGSACMIIIGAIHLVLIALFVRLAQKSQGLLLLAFKSAWISTLILSLLILLGQTILFAATFNGATVVFFNAYFSKIIVSMLFLGAWAFYEICKIIWNSPTPLSQEPSAQPVSEESAPRLWAKVKEISEKVGTQTPDTILVGMSTAFYVTELPVLHSEGLGIGRTLHLSAPMMQHLSVDEVSAIVGHEMGHFKGQDTRMTREMMPQTIKSNGTLGALEQAGLIGLPAFYAMLAFRSLFDKTVSAFNRRRELDADAWGAKCTSPRALALALVRYSYEEAVHDMSEYEHLVLKTPREQALAENRERFSSDETFWSDLMTHALPHPFDSHPPIQERVEKLGFNVQSLKSDAITPVDQSAFDALLDNSAIETALAAHARLVKHTQQAIEVKQAAAEDLSPDIVAEHFPKFELKTKRLRVAAYAIQGVFLVIAGVGFSGALLSLLEDERAFYLLIPIALGLAYLWFRFNRPWWGRKLVVDHHGIYMSYWDGPISFSDIAEIHVENTGTLWQWPGLLLVLENAKRMSVNVAMFQGKGDETAATVIRYFERGLR